MVAGRDLGHTLAGEGVHFWIGIAETGKGGLIPHFILPTVVNSVGYAVSADVVRGVFSVAPDVLRLALGWEITDVSYLLK